MAALDQYCEVFDAENYMYRQPSVARQLGMVSSLELFEQICSGQIRRYFHFGGGGGGRNRKRKRADIVLLLTKKDLFCKCLFYYKISLRVCFGEQWKGFQGVRDMLVDGFVRNVEMEWKKRRASASAMIVPDVVQQILRRFVEIDVDDVCYGDGDDNEDDGGGEEEDEEKKEMLFNGDDDDNDYNANHSNSNTLIDLCCEDAIRFIIAQYRRKCDFDLSYVRVVNLFDEQEVKSMTMDIVRIGKETHQQFKNNKLFTKNEADDEEEDTLLL